VGRAEIPAEEKLDILAIARAIEARGGRARACRSTTEAIEAAVDEAKAGDTIVVMSNGRFDDAPDRILLALMQR
jgi:UDP-N-acetylmuramate-alanine ligase